MCKVALRLPVTLLRTGTVVVTVLLSAIEGHAVAIYVFSCSDKHRDPLSVSLK